MAKNIRLILSAFVAVLNLSFTSLAAAQGVHEIRPSASDEVIIGVDGPVSIETVVAFARRLTGNTAITSEDVIANLPHARRYACRHEGRLVYFGTDPDYGGRCPDEGVRSDGVLRGSAYHVPRVHGVVLARTTRVTRRATPETLPTAVAVPAPVDPSPEILERAIEAETALVEANRRIAHLVEERDLLQDAVDARPVEPSVEYVIDPAQAEEIARLTAELETARAALAARPTQPLGWRHALLILMGFGFGLTMATWLVRRDRAKLADQYREYIRTAKASAREHAIEEEEKNLEATKRRMQATIDDGRRAIRTLETRYKARVERLRAAIVWMREQRDDLEQRLGEFMSRLTRVPQLHAELAQLRAKEDDYDNLLIQIRIAEDMRAEAAARNDEIEVAKCDQVIEVYRSELAKLSFDPEGLKLQIAQVMAEFAEKFQAQSGYELEHRPALEIKTEYEERMLTERRELEAKRRTHEALIVLIEEDHRSLKEEVARQKRALEAEYAIKEGKREAKFWLMAAEKGELKQDYSLNLKTLERARKQLTEAETRLRELEASEAEHRLLLAGFAGDPTSHAQLLIQRDERIADLEKMVRDAGLEPGRGPRNSLDFFTTDPPPSVLAERMTPTPMNGSPRRMATAAPDGERPSQIPKAPTSPGSALTTALVRFLDTVSGMPPELRTVECNKREAADWAYFLSNWKIRVSELGVEHLFSRLTVTSKGTDRILPWGSGRLRQKTDPPPPPETPAAPAPA